MVVRFLSFRQVEWNSFSTFQLCEKLYQGKELVPYHNNIFWLPFTLIKESETAWKLGKDAARFTLINHNLAVLYRDIWIIQPNITTDMIQCTNHQPKHYISVQYITLTIQPKEGKWERNVESWKQKFRSFLSAKCLELQTEKRLDLNKIKSPEVWKSQAGK